MRFMQIELVLQTKNRSEPAKNWFSVALVYRGPDSGGAVSSQGILPLQFLYRLPW